jgi:hypothetical protein
MYYYGKTLINNCITWIISLINMNWIELKYNGNYIILLYWIPHTFHKESNYFVTWKERKKDMGVFLG